MDSVEGPGSAVSWGRNHGYGYYIPVLAWHASATSVGVVMNPLALAFCEETYKMRPHVGLVETLQGRLVAHLDLKLKFLAISIHSVNSRPCAPGTM